ncbi:MAG: class I SAM-dependent methyltransferase [Patescibacteria group bacterium]|nr:class I SAM-dependent methyltransferase [Patescibacteria group bacterium]
MKLLWNYKALTFDQEVWQNKIFPQHQWLLKTITRLDPQTILEVGCGFGRNLKFLLHHGLDPRRLAGVDFSQVMLHKAKRNLGKKLSLTKASVLKLPFQAKKFDLVFTHGLLMHLPPPDLPQALVELTRVSKKYLIIIEEIRVQPRQLNYFTWAHDYDKIISTLPLQVVIKKKGKYSLIWYLLKK